MPLLPIYKADLRVIRMERELAKQEQRVRELAAEMDRVEKQQREKLDEPPPPHDERR